MPKKYPTQTVSIPDLELLAAAKVKAKSQGRSLSNYLCRLLEADLRAAGTYPPLENQGSFKVQETPASSIHECNPSSVAKVVLHPLIEQGHQAAVAAAAVSETQSAPTVPAPENPARARSMKKKL